MDNNLTIVDEKSNQKEEIIEAANKIKEYCAKRKHCDSCPFSIPNTVLCIFDRDIPEEWKLKKGGEK